MNSLRLFQHARLDAAAGVEIVLHANRPLRLANARGRRIRCTGGCAWLTAPGLIDDIFLHAGESWEIGSDGLVLIEAVAAASVVFDA